MEQQPSYIVFARYPELHKVKTRLEPLLGAENTLRLYTAMMLDTVEKVLQRNARVMLCVTPVERVSAFQKLLAHEGIASPLLSVVAQQGDTLGDRMEHAFRQARHDNALPAIIVGTDSPTLPITYLQQAEHALRANASTVVLGPSEDGGFYLLGLTQLQSQYFLGDNYSHADVYTQTREAIQQHGGIPVVLPMWYDIDNEQGLQQLRTETASAMLMVARRTRAALRTL